MGKGRQTCQTSHQRVAFRAKGSKGRKIEYQPVDLGVRPGMRFLLLVFFFFFFAFFPLAALDLSEEK